MLEFNDNEENTEDWRDGTRNWIKVEENADEEG